MTNIGSVNRAIYEVIQDILRQRDDNAIDTFKYRLMSSKATSYATSDEQLRIIKMLKGLRLLEFRYYKAHNYFSKGLQRSGSDEQEIENHKSDVYELTVYPVGLKRYADEIKRTFPKEVQQPIKEIEKIECTLRLDDLDLKLKIGDNDEQTIGRLHEERAPHKLMVALQHVPVGTRVHHARIFSNASHKNLWQIMVRSDYGYLSPFFDRPTASEIGFKHKVQMTKDELKTLISKINEKYRKNLSDIVKEL